MSARPGDLVRFGCSLKVECTYCHAARALSGIEVMQVHGSRTSLERLASRLICSGRNKKAARLAVLPPA
jgi:hypothetical protein